MLEGSAGADDIDGEAGSDTASYAGSAAAVTVNLSDGPGNDRIITSWGHNTLNGEDGDDYLSSGPGDDRRTGGRYFRVLARGRRYCWRA